MKFIHTADWHLGRQFHNVSLIDDQQAVLNQLIEYIKNNPVDAVVVAGDIYDRSVPPTVAIKLLNQVVDTICHELSIPMILISGNHDGAERLGFAAQSMKGAGLHIVSNLEQMLEPIEISGKSGVNVKFWGMPYNDPELVRHTYQIRVADHDEAHQHLAAEILSRCNPSDNNVLVSHCFVDGAIESDSERPLSIGGSDRVCHEHFVPFDYVALGHLHQPQMKGEEYIRYSGSLMKYSFSEQHQKKGFTLVEFSEQGLQSFEHIDLTAPHQMRIIEGEMDEILQLGKTDANNHDYLMVRLQDKHAILNPMDKLRQVYPNVLHLEKPGMLMGVEQEIGHARLARSEFDMFKDFFSEAQESGLNQEQATAIRDILKTINDKGDR